jgi:hypothetical protein
MVLFDYIARTLKVTRNFSYSIFTVITGIILSVGFLYHFLKLSIFTNYNIINSSTIIFFVFFKPFIIYFLQFLSIIDLIISISLFATCYGLL